MNKKERTKFSALAAEVKNIKNETYTQALQKPPEPTQERLA